MTGWNSLPQEIRSMILGYVVVHDHIAPYAPVSIEWRDAIERKTFQHICIQTSPYDAHGSTPTVLQTLSRLRCRQRRLVKHLWLNYELVAQNSDGSWNDEEHCISVSITQLFQALQFWPAQDDLTLEINVYEPRYCSEEWFRGHHIGVPGEQDKVMSLLSDTQLQGLSMPSHLSLSGLFSPLAFKLQSVPSVPAVTKFLLPRQCRRQLEPDTLSCILKRLPRLEEISLETWDVSKIHESDYVERNTRHLFLQPDSFKNVKSMTVFQDRNEYFNAVAHHHRAWDQRYFLPQLWPLQPQPSPSPPDKVPWERPVLSREFAVASLSLENLSLSFIVDAVDFFGQCQEYWIWADLRSLTLTSRLLTYDGDSSKIHEMLYTAAHIAKRMPKLERLTIWNGGVNEACAFTYRKQQHNASVTWQAKGGTKLNSAVYSAWENLHSGCFLRVEEKDTWYSITSHVAAIMCLGLEHVVDHVSLRQMQLENSIPWGDI
ncbi:f-box domain-containing protein [Fusarium phyllophilum]|uniref:F-box domain-containing protein n=1 Tax=Fusarium phyllophilum TaxID=47803 RepID=A0A8H5K8I2_9HYPO|nr:f-box domain-containing protein [Fusarium phyllophilum]